MSTLDELLYYCQEENSYGALMLTGQWGCGKTYLIEHSLVDDLGDSYIVIRISLFGIDSVEKINRDVQKKFFEAILRNADDYFTVKPNRKCKLSRIVSKTAEVAAGSDKRKKLTTFFKDLAKCFPSAERFFSIEPSDYFPVEAQIGSKKIVLIFDDLERTDIDGVKVLGCINEYCENKRIKTILVTNEERLVVKQDSSNCSDGKSPANGDHPKISYKEIKEKIVSRTIICSPDYESIITNILDKFNDKQGDYTAFLHKHKDEILRVFLSGENQNIRSLKCALQDFQRVYRVFVKCDFTANLDKYLCAFIALVLCSKEGIVSRSENYGNLFSDLEVEKRYPLYYRRAYTLSSVKAWVLENEWNESGVKGDIAKEIENHKAMTPEAMVRLYPFISLDEDTISKGLHAVVSAAYAGALSVDEYLTLLQNIAWARKISYVLPVEIDTSCLKSGVEICLKRISDSDNSALGFGKMPSAETENALTSAEQEIHSLIRKFREESVQMFCINRRAYLSALSKPDLSDMYQCENKRYNVFDDEMALAVAAFYARLQNADRQVFISLFNKMWGRCATSQDIQIIPSIRGFEHLKCDLEESRMRELESKLQIQAALTEFLISIIDNVIKGLHEAKASLTTLE